MFGARACFGGGPPDASSVRATHQLFDRRGKPACDQQSRRKQTPAQQARRSEMPELDRFLVDGRPPGFVVGEHTLTLEVGLMGEDFQRLAARELRESPDVVRDALTQLRELLRGEKQLDVPLDDENLLLTFLRPCKFYPHSAFDRMRKYYRFAQKNPRLSGQLTPGQTPGVFEQDLLSVLPRRDQHGRRILLLEAGGKWKTGAVSASDIHRALWLVLGASALEPRTQVAGAVVLLDMHGLAAQHVWQISPAFARNLAHWVQECIPARLKAVHIVRQPYVFNMLFAVFKPFLQEKLRNRIHFHGTDWGSLHRQVVPGSLPRQFGGELDVPAGTASKLHSTLCLFEDVFREYSEYGYKQ
ncbi:alpha-tocopherol transfer protein-like [Bacillus rossius redtenbacheri]|uniref:alpha-tocopherol transfer protein-like n=1 Tax=Bacillus rossius redtenbacheri TaxID=93214 RepID=UPI002FDED030